MTNQHSLLIAVAALAVHLASAPALAQSPSERGLVAVLPVDAAQAGVSRADIQAFEETIRTAAGDQLKPRGYTVLTGETTLAILADNGVDPDKACESSCALEAARHLTARLFISGSLARTEGEFVAFIRLYEIEAGAQLGSMHVEGPTMRDLRRQFMEKAPEFFARAMRTVPGQAGVPGAMVSVGGVVLEDVPVLSSQLSEGGVVRLDVDTDVLVAHADAVEKDANGKQSPAIAAAAWEKLQSLGGRNPYRAEAAARAKLWREYDAKQKAFAAQLAEDTQRLERLLPLPTLSTTQKSELLGSYVASYGQRTLPALLARVPSKNRAEVCMGLAKLGVGRQVDVAMPFRDGVRQTGRVSVDSVSLGNAPGSFRVPGCSQRIRVESAEGSTWEQALPSGDETLVLQPAFPGLHAYSYSEEWHRAADEHDRQRRRIAGPRKLGVVLAATGAVLVGGALITHAVTESSLKSVTNGSLGSAAEMEAAYATAVSTGALRWLFALGGAAGLGTGVPLLLLNRDPGEFQPPTSTDR